MPEYRAYFLDKTGHIAGPAKIIEAETDDQAVEAATPLVDGHDVEVWLFNRRVAVLKHAK